MAEFNFDTGYYFSSLDNLNRECRNYTNSELKYQELRIKYENEIYNKALDDFRKGINGFLCDSAYFADFVVTDGAIDCVIDELKKCNIGQNDATIMFKNGSWIKTRTSSENSRSARANILVKEQK